MTTSSRLGNLYIDQAATSYLWSLHCFETFCTTLGWSQFQETSFCGWSPICTGLGFVHYFHCQIGRLFWNCQCPIGFLVAASVSGCALPMPCYSLQYLDHFPLVYVRQNINGILLQPTAFVCSLNSLKCQTSGNFTSKTRDCSQCKSGRSSPGSWRLCSCRVELQVTFWVWSLPYFCKSTWNKARGFYLAWRTKDLGNTLVGYLQVFKVPTT